MDKEKAPAAKGVPAEKAVADAVTEPLLTVNDFIIGLALKDMREIAAAFVSKYDGSKTKAEWQELFTNFTK